MNRTPQAEAAALAADLPALLLEARRLAGLSFGAHGRRRAGPGEAFWQYRDHRPEDGARLVDWRRSARGERLYVREREREAAQTLQLWIDPAAGFNWSSAPQAHAAKRSRALVLALALAELAARGGERVGMLGGPLYAGAGATERLAFALMQPESLPETPLGPVYPGAALVLFSDFYAPPEAWAQTLAGLAAAGGQGALAMICDPAEEEFPFAGRVRFVAHDGPDSAVFGRAEDARGAYRARLAAHRLALLELGARYHFPLITHRTDQPGAPALMLLSAALAGGRP